MWKYLFKGSEHMREIKVSYFLTDQEEKRLKTICGEYSKYNLNYSEDQLFDSIMRCGSSFDINGKFKYHERILGLREDL